MHESLPEIFAFSFRVQPPLCLCSHVIVRHMSPRVQQVDKIWCKDKVIIYTHLQMPLVAGLHVCTYILLKYVNASRLYNITLPLTQYIQSQIILELRTRTHPLLDCAEERKMKLLLCILLLATIDVVLSIPPGIGGPSKSPSPPPPPPPPPPQAGG